MNGCVTMPNKPKKDDGYVRIMRGRKRYYAHRYAYEQENGPLPEGYEIDHLCKNRACINLDHLEPVTHKTNMERSNLVTLANGVCRNGHDVNTAGIYVHPTTGPTCRECKRESVRRYRSKLNKKEGK